MPKRRQSPEPEDTLRGKGHEPSAEKPRRTSSLDPAKLLHELQTHQAELEAQNEELRRARMELEESRERFIDLYDFAPVGYLSLTEEGIIGRINLTAAQLLGFERGYLVGKPLSSLAAKESGEVLYLHQRGVLSSKRKQVCECVFIKKDGSTFDARLESIPVERDGLKIIRAVLTDIRERKRIEEKLQESERLFRAIADYTYDCESWHAPDGRLLWINPAVHRLTGYTPDECRAMPDFPLPLIDARDRERMASTITAGLGGSSGNDVEFRIMCKDGSLKWGPYPGSRSTTRTGPTWASVPASATSPAGSGWRSR